ncbi:MAG: hypothetical protein Q8N23_36235 [Archangium sp.]|nr:hypothetical protein [Archangium sp.]MDP3158178.1 hypothetical protein [Archangium sp.]MDP3574112.1 hypothetical protein [Archangium sp.]
MRALYLLAVTAWAGAATPAAAASSPKLEEARKLIDDLEMEAALKALDAADKTEGNDRATVLEIYTLQGIAFGSLSKEAKTRDSFRKLLMISPGATLPNDLPPRVRTPFFEAKEWVGTNGPLTVTGAANVNEGQVTSVSLVVEKDVLRLARTARFHLRATDGSKQTVDVPFSAGKAEATVGKAGLSWWAEVLSDRKGVLLMVASAGAPRQDGQLAPVAQGPQPLDIETQPGAPGGWRRTTGFVLLGAGAVAAGIGVGLGASSAGARSRLTNATQDDQGRVTSITQAEAGPLEASANTQATIANVLFGVGGALGAAGVVLVILGPASEPTVALSPAPGGLLVSGRF